MNAARPCGEPQGMVAYSTGEPPSTEAKERAATLTRHTGRRKAAMSWQQTEQEENAIASQSNKRKKRNKIKYYGKQENLFVLSSYE